MSEFILPFVIVVCRMKVYQVFFPYIYVSYSFVYVVLQALRLIPVFYGSLRNMIRER